MNEKTVTDPTHYAGPSSEWALLVLLQEGGDGAQRSTVQTWVLEKPITTIGRWEDNDIVIPDRWVSRHHAQIRREGTRHVIVDLDSKNGLFVNGKRVARSAALENGDRIQIAPRYALTFVDNEATAPLFQGQSGVLIDEGACRVWVKGQELKPPLSSAQFALLKALAGSPGLVYSRDDLTALVWPGEDPSGISDEALNSLVRRLRKRLMSIDASHRYIYAIRGHGFKFEQPDHP